MFDPRFRKLSGTQKWFFVVSYLSAVEARSELLPPSFDLAAIRDRAGIDTKTARKCLEKCLEVGLLEEPAQGRIRVIGVRGNHQKLDWNELSLDSPYGANTGLKREEDKIKEREAGAGAASLRVPGAHASPPAENKASSNNERTLIKGLIKNMNPSSAKELPEIEPDEAQIAEAQQRVAMWGIGELVRYTATMTKTGKLTDTLNEALSIIPESKLREVCIYVFAKAGVNSGRGWSPKKSGAVLTARCKEVIAKMHEQPPETALMKS
jgi:hypothetical protein